MIQGVKTSRPNSTDPMVVLRTSNDSFVLVKAPDYPQVIIAMTIRLYMWMMPLALPLLVSAVGSISNRSYFVWCMTLYVRGHVGDGILHLGAAGSGNPNIT